MLAIRLTRTGAKKRPSYRIIVSEKRYKRDGAYIENLGHYNPLTEPTTLVVDKDRFDYWIKAGAQPTAVVKRLVLGVKGTKKRKPRNAPEEEAEAPAAAPQTDTAQEATAVSTETVAETPPEPMEASQGTVEDAAPAEETTEEKTEA